LKETVVKMIFYSASQTLVSMEAPVLRVMEQTLLVTALKNLLEIDATCR
jgi:hypothetical protein